MKTLPRTCRRRAFTFKELVVVLAAAVVLGALVLPTLQTAGRKAKRIGCISRLKQIGLACRLWAGDFGATNTSGWYPARASTNAGGAREWVLQGQVWPVFQLMSNELNTPVILVCPADTRRLAAGFSVLRNTNLSYFVGLEADMNQPEGLLAGDRNLEAAGLPLAPGVVILNTNQRVGWTRAQHRIGGNVGLADGSVQQLSPERLHEHLTRSGQATNRLVLP